MIWEERTRLNKIQYQEPWYKRRGPGSKGYHADNHGTGGEAPGADGASLTGL